MFTYASAHTKAEDVSIGYNVSGEGEESIIYVPGAYSNLTIEQMTPESIAWEKFLGRFGRVINFDKRATGVSDRSARPLNLDQQVVDVEAVRAATDSENLILVGLSQGAPLGVLYALAFPERTRALILLEGVCCDARNPYRELSASNTLFDWDSSVYDLDNNYDKWAEHWTRMMFPDADQEMIDFNLNYMYATASPAH